MNDVITTPTGADDLHEAGKSLSWKRRPMNTKHCNKFSKQVSCSVTGRSFNTQPVFLSDTQQSYSNC